MMSSYSANCDKTFLINWYEFLLLLDRVFSEPFRTNFNPQFSYGIEVGLKLFLIYT